MRVIAVFNHKGGVGKTTTVANLGAGLARRGRRVLLVDIDPQACLSVHFGLDPESTEKTIYDVLCRDLPLAEAVRPLEGDALLGVPSHLDLAGAELELATTMGRERLLRDALDKYLESRRDIDYVFFDCPPSLGILTVNALAAADEVFVPLQTEFLALRGVGKLVDVVTLVRRRLNPSVKITGILPTLSRTGTLLAREVQEEIARHFGPKVFKTRIRSNVKLAEAPSHGQSIFAYAPGSAGAEDYAALATEVDVMDVPHRVIAPREPEISVDEILARVEPPAS
ncbi:MAG TPA: AAA family ATPase [Planctomycetota bacterium]|nr:AAA family ATPase [Planctomycetota bacterium]